MTPHQLADEVERAARDRRWDDVHRFLAKLVVLATAPGLAHSSAEVAAQPRPQPDSLDPSDPTT